ncbi:MAG: hypothetical protein JWM41_2039 [Gemmatimonadetes bacterium]|nr:hypothetical protein [Gemmatimonadota bacterium]
MARLFISHASEDKAAVAEPVYRKLLQLGHEAWLDRFELTLGDTLSREIDKGLSACDFGVVILSPRFFAKSWPRVELDALVAREAQEGQKRILPVWHDVVTEDVARYSPILATKLGISTSHGIEAVVDAIERALRHGRPIGESFQPEARLRRASHITVRSPSLQVGDRGPAGLLYRAETTFVNAGSRAAVLSFQLRFQLDATDIRAWVAIPEGPMHENERIRVEAEGFATRELIFHFTDTTSYGGRESIRRRDARLWITDHVSGSQSLVTVPTGL